MRTMKETFLVPDFKQLLSSIERDSDKVVVISIIGKSAYSTKGQKVKGLGKMFSSTCNNSKEYAIEGYYDDENQIIYLHVRSMMDAENFTEHYQELVEEYEKNHKVNDFLEIFNKIKSIFARILFLLFSVSHIVVLSHPRADFDLSFIRFIKAVENLRMNISSNISDALKQIEGLPHEWVVNNRFCTPRLIFHFETSPKGVTNIKKLEHNMEDRIYRILRKTRIVGNYSLFSIPLNEEFIFVSTEDQTDEIGEAVKRLYVSCQLGRMIPAKNPFFSNPTPEHSIQGLLAVHVQQARTKGFDDNVSSRHSQAPAYFLLPTIKHWIEACKVLFEIIVKPEILPSLCTDTKFSEQRCLKVLPIALARYQEGLPSHYTKAVHEGRLALALSLFAAQARGSLFQQYSDQLVGECQALWESGKQLCEVASLTGNPCTLPKHSKGEHCSGVRYIASCDCGRKQSSREDPYTAQQANYEFYYLLSMECSCGTADRITFPIFEPSTKEFKAATLTTEMEEVLSVRSEDRSQLTSNVMEKNEDQKASTTEYLPGMLTLSSPSGLLPKFSSWSLLCLGPSSLYSHNLGLSESQHPGFLNSTNYLLPWDVTVTSKVRSGWPQMSKHAPRGRRPRPSGSLPQFTVKVFIGVEYECPRGHRFMLAAPDKVLRANPGSMVKDTGHKIAESDMPLYYPCPCRSMKPLTAQLMRLHVVTPKAPVNCSFYPRVQPAAGAPIFVASPDGPISVTQSAYWVMRLPYVYVSDKGNYPENISARLLAKVFAVSAIED